MRSIKDTFSLLQQYGGNEGKDVISGMINNFIESDEIDKEEIGNYVKINEPYGGYVTVNRLLHSEYKCFDTENEAIDYCLDKINEQGKQIKLEL